ncbi:MAG: transcription elongation factor GreA [SAR202 cluster bacterium]|nr:MAG: transcription elongation factor GreA [SAR202 cluster bacterium]KAA1299262.1 MAG: transcription elongation factor GreA [SAR202 cluster bacterium]
MSKESEVKTKVEEKDIKSEIDNLSAAFQYYVQSSSRKLNNTAQQEIGRMVRWLGAERVVETITPSEIGLYSDEFAKRSSTTTSPQKVAHIKKFLAFLRTSELTNSNLASHLRMKKSNVGKITKKLEDTKVEQINLTEAGYKDYLKQLKDYKSERPQLADEVRRAAADGDIRENAPLDAAREKIEMVNSKIFEIEAILKVANIIDNTTGGDRIVIGSKVSVKNHQNENNYEYQLVEANEANPLLGKISSVSPVGSAILGRRIGDEVTVSTPGGEQIYTIDSIN